METETIAMIARCMQYQRGPIDRIARQAHNDNWYEAGRPNLLVQSTLADPASVMYAFVLKGG